MAENSFPPVSYVDSTIRLRWEVTKQSFDSKAFDQYIQSPTFTVTINGEESEWFIYIYPKGDSESRTEEDKETSFSFGAVVTSGKHYDTYWQTGIETSDGYWPDSFAKKVDYSIKSFDNYFNYRFSGDNVTESGFFKTEDFVRHFVDNKLTLVVSMVVYVEADDMDFVDDIRSIPALENLSDFTVIAGNSRFPTFRVLLAARSKYFEAMFRNDPAKKELEMDESPELVKVMLDFMTKGSIPNDLSTKAMDLIDMADMYGLDLLTVACETELVEHLSPDSALQTLIVLDKLKHISKVENRRSVIKYIIDEAAQIVGTENWSHFMLNYPSLVNDIVLAKSS